MPVISAIQLQLKEHEQWLVSLRQSPGMTTAKIRVVLEKEKNIQATPSQLETYFRSLGQRKNLSRHDWIAIFRALDSQRAFGNHLDLFLSGKLITDQELKKKRKNAKPPEPLVECHLDADHLLTQLPVGVTVQPHLPPGSPVRDRQHSIVPESISMEIPDINQDLGAVVILDSIVADNPVPGQGIIVHDRGTRLGSVGALIASPSNRNQSRLLSISSNTEEFPTLQPIFDSGDFEVGDWDAIPFPSPGGWDRLARQFSPGAFLPSLQPSDPGSQNAFWVPGLNYASPTSIVPSHRTHDPGLMESARQLPGGFDAMISGREWHASDQSLPTAEEVIGKLQSLMLINTDGDFGGTVDVVDGSGVLTDQFIQLLLFSVVNNFAGLDKRPGELVIKFINGHETSRCRVLQHLRDETPTLYSRAFTEKLLKAAITACDARTLQELLALKIVAPDDIVYVEPHLPEYQGERRMTAIEQASRLRQFEIVEVLLRYDADVEKTYEPPHSDHERGALEFAIGLWNEYEPIDIRFVDLLLNNGASVNGRLVAATIRWGDARLIEKLMSRISPSEHEYLFQQRIQSLTNAAEYLKNDLGYRVVRQMMQACQNMHDNKCLASAKDQLVEAMTQAARRNNRDLVKLLLPHGGQDGLDSSLTGAAKSGSHSLVQLLIAAGARATADPHRIGDSEPEYDTTALAEAIRRDDSELVDLLAKVGAWDQIGEPGRLRAAMRAIAESGNSAYLGQLLQLVPNPSKEALGRALLYAVKASHEEIALQLLELGASPSSEGFLKPLVEALRIKNKSMTWAILECEMTIEDVVDGEVLEAAIAWGNQDIIEALLFMGNGLTFCQDLSPLSFAIKAGKKSLVDFMITTGADMLITMPCHPTVPPFFALEMERPDEFSSPLSATALARDEATAKWLLDRGADPADEHAIINAITHDRSLLDLILQAFRGRYPQGRKRFGGKVLLHTLKTRDEPALDLCLRAGFDVNNMTIDLECGMITALGLAIKKYHSHLETISKLLNAGGDPNLPASMEVPTSMRNRHRIVITARRTAFLDAIETKDLSLVKLLISKGAHVQKEAKWGLKRTPFQTACEVGSHSIVDLFLTKPADVNEAPAACGGATALQLAAKTGSLRMAKKLLDLGAKVDAPGARFGGRSAIEYAAEYGRLEMILLLFNAAGGKLPAEQCDKAKVLAKENGHMACADLITDLSTRNQTFLDDCSMADDGGRANVVT